MPIRIYPPIVIPDEINAALALKLNKSITHETVTSLALTLASFNGKLGVYRATDANATITLDNDLKDGVLREILILDSHVSTTITIATPTPYYGDTSPAAVTAGKYITIYFYWNSNISKWHIRWTGVEGVA